MKVVPEKTYSVKEAARYLGVHRCTIYAYIRYLEKPLAFLKIPDKAKRVFRGTDLIATRKPVCPNVAASVRNTVSSVCPMEWYPKDFIWHSWLQVQEQAVLPLA